MINKLIIDTLKPLNIPVSFQEYFGVKQSDGSFKKTYPYITFFEYLQQGEAFADNQEQATGYYVQVDIWSKTDYTDLVLNVKNRLKNIGFTRTSEADLYEQNTSVYHKAIRFFYCEEREVI